MTKPHSEDLRLRVVEFVETGGSVRDAESIFSIGASSASRWSQRFRASGSVTPDARVGRTSPLDGHADFLMSLIAESADITLAEIVTRMAEIGISASNTSVWRFFDRQGISYKKNGACRRTRPAGRTPGARRLERKPARA